jgi:hypothetical protein
MSEPAIARKPTAGGNLQSLNRRSKTAKIELQGISGQTLA